MDDVLSSLLIAAGRKLLTKALMGQAEG